VFCSRECAARWRRSPPPGVRVCQVCRAHLDPSKRVDAVCCSDKCKGRLNRRVDADERFELLKGLVGPKLRDQVEAWRRLERANPENYMDTPMAARLRREQLEADAVLKGTAVRGCEHCGALKLMRRSQRYCSGRCRVAAHRLRRRV